MKKLKLILLFFLVLTLAGGAAAENAPSPADSLPRVILYGVYRPDPGTDRVALGCLDEAGDLWLAEQAEASWPAATAGIEKLLSARRGMHWQENVLEDLYDGCLMDREWLNDLAAMADTVPLQEGVPEETGLAGWQLAVYAMRTAEGGESESVLLGMGGRFLFENTDPGAQMMYRWMWRKLVLMEIFTSDAGYAAEGIEPHGFETVSLREFFRLPDGSEEAEITAESVDCLTGFQKMELVEEDLDEIRTLVRRGVVIGKRNSAILTGGTIVIRLQGADGQDLGSMEFYKTAPDEYGSQELLAVAQDGMYSVSLLPEPVDALAEEEQGLLAFTLNGGTYTLGKSTPRDLVRDGWICFPEYSKTMTFRDGETNLYLEVWTAGGSLDEPLRSVYFENLESADSYRFGFDGIVSGSNPEVYVPLSDGRTFHIATWDGLVQITLKEAGDKTEEVTEGDW